MSQSGDCKEATAVCSTQHLHQLATQCHSPLTVKKRHSPVTVKKQLLSAAHTHVSQLHKMWITEGLYEYLGAFVDTLYGDDSKFSIKLNVVRSSLLPAVNGVQSGA